MSKNSRFSSIENDFLRFEKDRLWNDYFCSIKSEAANSTKHLSMELSKKPLNRKFNRYSDVMPYDHSRVVIPDYNGTDYINANYVSLEDNKYNRKYILAQGPLPFTISHFWSMIWNENSRCIIMVTKEVEKGKVKCARYYPTSEQSNLLFEYPDFALEVTLQDQTFCEGYVKSTFNVEHRQSGEQRKIHHYCYFAWPDFGVPAAPNLFLQFLWDVRKSGEISDPSRPSIVHCSAGIGRSGTLVAIDLALMHLADPDPLSSTGEEVDIRKLILLLRQSRYGLVQSPEQLRFIYMAVLMGAKKMENATKSQQDISSIQFIDGVLDMTSSVSNGETVASQQQRARELSAEEEEDDKDDSEDTSSMDEDGDSDFIDNSDDENTNSTLDKAAAAVRNRRGLPALDATGFEESIVVGQAPHKTHMMQRTTHNATATESDVLDKSPVPATQRAPEIKSQDSTSIRDSRIQRTRQMIADIRDNMRRQEMERSRPYYQTALVAPVIRLAHRCGLDSRNSLILGLGALVGAVSVATGLVLYRFSAP